MATEPERYLRKARESLASAEADAEAGRFNSAANRAYYACFQAVVAALIHAEIRPSGSSWQHSFVISQVSGKLIKRRKLLSGSLYGHLQAALDARLEADYQPTDVSERLSRRVVRNAADILEDVERMMNLRTLREATADYEARVADGLAVKDLAEKRIAEVQGFILERIPTAQFGVEQVGPKDFRLRVLVPTEDDWEDVHPDVAVMTTDILCDDEIWIVTLASYEENSDV